MAAAQATAAVPLYTPFRPYAASETITVRLYRTLEELTSILPAWEQLLSAYPLASTFSTWEWLSCWWQHFERDRKLLVLGLFDTGGLLIGLAPFAISTESYAGVGSLRVLRLMGDGSLDSDNLDMPVLPGYESAFADCVLRHLKALRAEWDICELNTLPPGSPAAALIAHRCQLQGWTLFEDTRVCSAISLPNTWSAYLAALSSEDRKNVARYRQRLESRHRVRISRCSRVDEIEHYLSALFTLHQGRWESIGQLGSFASVNRRGFYRDLSAALLSRSWLELWGLWIEEDLSAVQFAFRYGDRVYQLQEGYDHTRPSDRLGLVLRGEVLHKLIEEKVRVYDFLGGADNYKARWGAKPGYYRTVRFALPFTAGSSILWIARKTAGGKVWLRQHMPSTAWRSIKHIAHAVGM
jgi:CelD/BcsL family acetyltransferase involved in cellulose biosynthesis